ncbi:hypothetical protein MMC25_004886 [Agyrium rufum]|nr:hypothetical protein [Agyrium rufum]
MAGSGNYTAWALQAALLDQLLDMPLSERADQRLLLDQMIKDGEEAVNNAQSRLFPKAHDQGSENKQSLLPKDYEGVYEHPGYGTFKM